MKYYVTLKNKTYEIEVDSGEAILLSETDNSKPDKKTSVDLSTSRNEPSGVIPTNEAVNTSATTSVGMVPVPDPSDNNTVLSPMPGNILDICVVEGQQVAEGDVIMILEAMKMENEIVALSSGIVQRILVSKDQMVQTGVPLAIIV